MEDNNVIILKGRIDSNNADEWERKIFDQLGTTETTGAVFDASELSYISSAGLRVLMKVRKTLNRKITVLNVSRDVFDIFDVTGFTQLFDVRKPLREISIDGCEEIGAGAYGHVYRIDPETIAKIYNPGLPLDFVEKERRTAQSVFLLGVPTAISYDVVKCGESFGVVYELLDAKTTAQLILEDRSRVVEIGENCGKFLKQMHKIRVPEEIGLPSAKQNILEAVKVFGKFITDEEAEKINALIMNIPDRNTFIHGDFNSRNIMVKDGEFQLIDIGDAAYGHPLCDFAVIMLSYVYLPSIAEHLTKDFLKKVLVIEPEDAKLLWDTICRTYFGFSEQKEIDTLTEKLMPFMHLILSTHSMRFAKDEAGKKASIDRTIRGQLIPEIDSMKSFAFLEEYFGDE